MKAEKCKVESDFGCTRLIPLMINPFNLSGDFGVRIRVLNLKSNKGSEIVGLSSWNEVLVPLLPTHRLGDKAKGFKSRRPLTFKAPLCQQYNLLSCLSLQQSSVNSLLKDKSLSLHLLGSPTMQVAEGGLIQRTYGVW